jgi:uncharacterized protein YbjT (DUF2867 family)
MIFGCELSNSALNSNSNWTNFQSFDLFVPESSPIQEHSGDNVYTITGITGKVGGTLARKLLEAGQPVRAVVRDAVKGQAWSHSFLTPAEKPFTMIATEDIGRIAVELIQQHWTGKRVVELEGPGRVSPNDLAKAFAKALGHPVRVEIVPRDTWETLFRGQGMKNPSPRRDRRSR